MKLVLIKDLDGNEITIAPNVIVKLDENESHTTIETKYGIILTKSSKNAIENSIHNCYLP